MRSAKLAILDESLELGAWNLEYGIWNMELGARNLEYGIWNSKLRARV